jgi:hypothetical protein
MPFHEAGAAAEFIPFATAFLFMFAVAFTLITYAGVIKSRPAAGVIAAVIGLVSSLYGPFAAFLQVIIPLASVGLVALFFIVLVNKLFKKEEAKDTFPVIAGLATMLLVLAGVWPNVAGYFRIGGLTADSAAALIILAVIGLLFIGAYKYKGG